MVVVVLCTGLLSEEQRDGVEGGLADTGCVGKL